MLQQRTKSKEKLAKAPENNIYLTTIYDFRIFSKITGNVIESQHFEHKLSSPVAENGKVFVAADLWLMAYE